MSQKQVPVQKGAKTDETVNLKQSDWFATVKKDLDQRRYNIAKGNAANTYNSTNIAQQLVAEYSPKVFTIAPIPAFDNKPGKTSTTQKASKRMC